MIKLIKSSFYREMEIKKELTEFITNVEILSMDKECKKYEELFSKKQQRKYSLFVNSGSSANLLLFQALLNLGIIKKGDKIGVSALTWPTNIMPLIQLGLMPIIIDCELDTLNISIDILKKNIHKLNGLFLTNVLGFSDEIEKIKKICLERKVIFLEDNCESLGSVVNGKLLGNFGLASTFSFYAGHHISTIEGGMVCTDDKKLYNMLIIARAHGWDRNLSEKEQKKIREKNNITDDFFARYIFYDLAYNCRPTEISGFLGQKQIQYWDEIVSRRENNFKKFQKIINDNDDFILFDFKHMDLVSSFAIPVICKNKYLFENYKKRFKKNNVEIRPIIAGNITKQPFYKKYIKSNKSYDNADFIHKYGFYFSNSPELTTEEISLLCDLLKK